MFSGFRGSGKTTELFRLKKSLEESGYVVLYGDALKYLNPAQEIDISDLLIVLAGTRHPAGWDTLRSLVYRRFDAPDFQKFFGGTGSESPLADELIDVCGGHFRDLLLLLRETILRTQTLPVTPEVIHSAIAAIRSNFMPIAIDDAKWLYQIGQVRDTVLPTTGEKDVNRLTRFLDTHFVLYFLNGKEWYDIHPRKIPAFRHFRRGTLAATPDARDCPRPVVCTHGECDDTAGRFSQYSAASWKRQYPHRPDAVRPRVCLAGSGKAARRSGQRTLPGPFAPSRR